MSSNVNKSETSGHFFVVDGDGRLRLPKNSALLDQLYKTPGVQVRLARPFGTPLHRKSRMTQVIETLSTRHRQILAELKFTSSNTPTATFSGADLLYGTDGLSRHPSGDYAVGPEITSFDRHRSRDPETGNRRPSSRGKRASYPFVEKSFLDRERDDGRAMNGASTSKPQVIKGANIRNSLVRGEQFTSQKANGSNSGREPDDLIATGTLFSQTNTAGVQTSRAPSNSTATVKSLPSTAQLPNGSAAPGSQKRSIVLPMSTPSSRLTHSSSFNGISNGPSAKQYMGNYNNIKEAAEPKYTDPLAGAPASFQQRLLELAALEAETIRWERTKKVKKKTKQDRDS